MEKVSNIQNKSGNAKTPMTSKITNTPDTTIPGAETEAQKPFVKLNFILMGISLLLIVAGFLLMLGSGNDSPNEFNYDIFSTRRIVVAPTLAFLGFVSMAFAIIYCPARKNNADTAKKETTENTNIQAADNGVV